MPRKPKKGDKGLFIQTRIATMPGRKIARLARNEGMSLSGYLRRLILRHLDSMSLGERVGEESE